MRRVGLDVRDPNQVWARCPLKKGSRRRSFLMRSAHSGRAYVCAGRASTIDGRKYVQQVRQMGFVVNVTTRKVGLLTPSAIASQSSIEARPFTKVGIRLDELLASWPVVGNCSNLPCSSADRSDNKSLVCLMIVPSSAHALRVLLSKWRPGRCVRHSAFGPRRDLS
jgi:hypothetical protein